MLTTWNRIIGPGASRVSAATGSGRDVKKLSAAAHWSRRGPALPPDRDPTPSRERSNYVGRPGLLGQQLHPAFERMRERLIVSLPETDGVNA